MDILVLSDIHGNINQLQKVLEKSEGDFESVVLVGDLTDFGPKEKAVEVMDLILEYTDQVIGVPGNCDPSGIEDVIKDKGVLIDGEIARISDYEFIGLGGSNPTPFNTPREKSDEEIKEILNTSFSKAEGKTVLVTHAPPKGYLDLTSGTHAGSESVLDAIKNYEPRLVLCGHIHEAKGRENLDESILINPGAVRDGNFAKINLKNNIKVEFSET